MGPHHRRRRRQRPALREPELEVLIGHAACLGAAFLWALTVSLFRGPIEEHGARAVNLAKCSIATLFLGVTVIALGQGGALAASSPADLGLVALSGIVGLTIGDSALFGAVNRIGIHRALLLQTMAPVFAAILAAVWTGERLRGAQGLGMALTLAGVVLVESSRGGRGDRGPSWRPGMILGVVAAMGQGFGIVIAKAGMAGMPILAASFLRLAAAAAGLALIGLLDGGTLAAARALRSPATARRVVPASFLGSYVAILLMMAGIAWAPASVAAVLLATTPVFGLVIDATTGRARVRARDVAGTLLAVTGVGLM